jgi:TPR repeat protein
LQYQSSSLNLDATASAVEVDVMRFLVSWLTLGLLLLQAGSNRALDDVESNGTVPFRSDNAFLTSVEDEGKLDGEVATFPEHRFGPVRRSNRLSIGLRQALSQPMQNQDVQRAEIFLNGLSDLRRRAEEGDAKAQYDLGRIYMFGLGVSQDYQQAAKWYEHAAEQGLAAAQFMIGFLYEQGKGVPRDYARALDYYRSATEQGHTTAANNLATLYLHGQGTRKNISTALKWYQFSAEHGDANGQCNLGTLYFDGDGVPKDYHEAAHWFRVAAEQGFPPAENKLAFLYFTGQGVVQNYGEAVEWMSRAAEQGYAQAQINLGDLYVEGKGVSLDYVAAYMWYCLGSADPRAAARIRNLSGLITYKQRIEGGNRASTWLSSHQNQEVSDEKAGIALKVD